MIIGLLATGAFAWDCYTDVRCPNDCFIYGDPEQITFHIDTTDIPAGWITSIEAGMDAWGSGPGELNVGPEWRVIKGSNQSNHGLDNGKNEIWDENAAWFSANAGGAFVPFTVKIEANDDDVLPAFYTCPLWGVEYDIIFNSELDWTTTLVSERADNQQNLLSVGQAMASALHIVSGLGFGGEFLTVNNNDPEWGGDVSQEIRISANDFLGVLDLHPCSGAGCADGSNIMLGRFVKNLWVNGTETVLDDFEEAEVWDSIGSEVAGEDWSAAQGVTITSSVSPHPLMLQLTGTEDNVDIEVRWRLTQNAACGNPFWPVGAENVTMDAGEQMHLRMTPFTVPATIPDGDYFICAIADPFNVVGETSEDDNNVRSERMFHVE